MSSTAGRIGTCKLLVCSALAVQLTLSHAAQRQGSHATQRQGHLIPPERSSEGSVTPDQVRAALGLNAADVVSIGFGGSDAAGIDVFSSAVASFPVEGGSYLVMSTGNTSSALMDNTAQDTSTILAGLDNSQGNDLVQISLVLQPPAGATCIAFDFRFFSEEFPEFVGSEYNDAFLAEINQGSPTPFQIVDNQVIAPDNFAFDTANNVISINTVFGVTAGAAAGTTYDGATPTLTAVAPLENPAAQVNIILSITDLGDSIYDSTAFVDNFRWFYGLSCLPGADADSDGDGLLDDHEMNGIDFDHDGTIDLDLPAFGADPMHKDIFVEIDYMVLAGTGGHTHKPKAAALQTLIDSFENAPVSNPDGTTGIHIHIDAGSDTIMNPVTNALWGTRSQSDVLTHQSNLGTVSGSNYNWTAFDGIKGVGMPGGSFSILRADVFHYCIFGHSLATSLGTTSGISRGISASDFLVTLGGWTSDVGTVNQQAGTLMHELGHNLNLRHGGGDNVNRKPNYLSIMSYAFQMAGLRIGGFEGNFDYSRFLLPGLVESTLDETIGLSGVAEAAGYGTRYFDAAAMQRIDDSLATIDWNGDGDALDNPVAVDINGDGSQTSLTGFDDWDAVSYTGGSVGHLGEAIMLPTESVSNDITEEVDLQIPKDLAVCLSGPGEVVLEVCQSDTYTYTVANTGELPDTYDLSASSSLGYGDVSVFPSTLFLMQGDSESFVVTVTVPDDAVVGSMDKLDIAVTSQTNALIMDTAETTTVIAADDTPPVIDDVVPDHVLLWPPNHAMVEVSIEVVSSDVCPPTCTIVKVESDEPVDGAGDGNTSPDWEITGDLTVNLRAERSGRGDGRVYTITIECVDPSGNTTTVSTEVYVPLSQKNESLVFYPPGKQPCKDDPCGACREVDRRKR